MAIKTMGALDCAFIVYPSAGTRSFEEVVVDATGGAMEPGTLLAQDGTSGKYVAFTGAETVAGILAFGIGAEEGRRTAVVRDCEVHRAELSYRGADQSTADAALADIGIIVRD